MAVRWDLGRVNQYHEEGVWEGGLLGGFFCTGIVKYLYICFLKQINIFVLAYSRR